MEGEISGRGKLIGERETFVKPKKTNFIHKNIYVLEIQKQCMFFTFMLWWSVW